MLSDPNSSSAAWNNVCNIFAVYGYDSEEAWAIMRGLLENGLVISTSSSVCFKAVDSGEYVVGLTYEDGADTLLKAGSDRIRIQYPENGASGTTMGCAMIENCPHPEAAKAMINFLMSPEGQEALATRLETLRFTNPKAHYEIKYLPADDTINWVSRDTSRSAFLQNAVRFPRLLPKEPKTAAFSSGRRGKPGLCKKCVRQLLRKSAEEGRLDFDIPFEAKIGSRKAVSVLPCLT